MSTITANFIKTYDGTKTLNVSAVADLLTNAGNLSVTSNDGVTSKLLKVWMQDLKTVVAAEAALETTVGNNSTAITALQGRATNLEARPGGLILETFYSTPGSFTWTKNAATRRIEVEVWGGGASGGIPTAGNPGGTSSWGGVLTATGGKLVAAASDGGGGLGGDASGGTLNLRGNPGGGVDGNGYGAPGGSAPRGGSGGRNTYTAGVAADSNGAQPGGGGAGRGAATVGIGTGGSGAYVYYNTTTVPATASVVVGAGGVHSNPTNFGSGGNGMVIVREYY